MSCGAESAQSTIALRWIMLSSHTPALAKRHRPHYLKVKRRQRLCSVLHAAICRPVVCLSTGHVLAALPPFKSKTGKPSLKNLPDLHYDASNLYGSHSEADYLFNNISHKRNFSPLMRASTVPYALVRCVLPLLIYSKPRGQWLSGQLPLVIPILHQHQACPNLFAERPNMYCRKRRSKTIENQMHNQRPGNPGIRNST